MLAVDDYHPAQDPREAQAMAQVASRLLRGVGNGVGRPRMRADTSLRPELTPRCVPLVSGERLPEGHSTAARAYPVPVAPGAVDPRRLAEAQACRPLYPLAMAAYLRWLAGRLDDLRAALPARFRALRGAAQQAGAHRREPGQVAHLYLALEVWLGFAVEAGAVTGARRDDLLAEAWRVLLAHAEEHGRDLAAETPVRLFLALLADGFAGKRAYVEAKSGVAPTDGERWGWEPFVRTDRDGDERHELRHLGTATLVGTLDGDWLLLYPEATYQFVAGAARAAGRVFPVEAKTLLRRLDEAGLIATEPGTGRRTPNVWTGHSTRRVIKLRRDAVAAPSHPGPGELGEEGQAASERPAAPAHGASPNGRELSGDGEGTGEGTSVRFAKAGLPSIPPLPPFGNQEEAARSEEVVELVVWP